MTGSWACFLQKFSSPWLDQLAFLITNLGSVTFFGLTIPILYWTWNKRAAYRISVLYMFDAYVNTVLKVVFHTPRPTPTECSRVIHPETGPGYAFPSGHAQSSTVFWGRLAVEVRSRAAWIFAAVITVLVSLSRVYLNVHWPIDVIGGILIGAVLLLLFSAASAVWERLDVPFWLRVLSTVALPAVMYSVYRQDEAPVLIGFLLGFPLGHLIEERYVGWNERASFVANVLKALVGLGGLAAVTFGLKIAMPATLAGEILRYALAGLWVSLGAPLLFVGLGLERH